jgi:hypothetical protein
MITTVSQATIDQCSHLWKANNHNPRWRLNRYFEILSYIYATMQTESLRTSIAGEDCYGSESATNEATHWVLDYKLTQHNSQTRSKSSQLHRATLFRGPQQIITYQREVIHEQYALSQLVSYHTKKYLWDKATYWSINWHAFKHSAKKLPINERVKMMKFTYGWLPIGSKRTAINPESTTHCPSCNAYETHDHLLRCPNPERAELRENFFAELQKCSEKHHMKSTTTTMIINCLEKWIDTRDKVTTMTTAIHSNIPLRAAVLQQNKIGWNHFLRGRISKSFQTMVNDSRDIPLSAYESNKWTIWIIRSTWTHVSDIWTLRNKHLHGNTIEETAEIARAKVLQSIKNLYDRRYELPKKDRKRLFPHWSIIEKKQTENLKLWLMTVRQTVNILLDESTHADDDPRNIDDEQ